MNAWRRKGIHGRQLRVSIQVFRERDIFFVSVLLVYDFEIWPEFSIEKEQEMFDTFIETVAKGLRPQARIRLVFWIKRASMLEVKLFDYGMSSARQGQLWAFANFTL